MEFVLIKSEPYLLELALLPLDHIFLYFNSKMSSHLIAKTDNKNKTPYLKNNIVDLTTTILATTLVA